MTARCPQDVVIAEFIDGVADDSTALAIRAHLDECDRCADLVALTVSDDREQLGRIGRYVVLHRVGSGGMGEVHAAYDPELDRKVAIKLHHQEVDDERQLVRLIHEARAAARLNHPNVVRVYDAGRVDDGRAFVAMELVAGTTLRARMGRAGKDRSWREIASDMLLAGKGLAAAHAAGLVHRDFKPENVLVAEDGRILVTDFGLARVAEHEATVTAASGETSGSITRTGTVAGTPGYMSPEQLAGRTADARSDQFAHAVTFYEALYGVRPFAGGSGAELLDAIRRGTTAPPRSTRRVPRWLRSVLVRALASDPAARHRDMNRMMRDVERGMRRPVVATGAGVLAVAAVTGWWVAHAQSSQPVCANAKDPVSAVWNADRASRLADALRNSGSPIAEAAWTQTSRSIDDYAARSAAALADACEATHVRRVQSAELLDRRSACIERILVDLDELLTAIAAADADAVPRAMEAVASMPAPSRCDADAVRASSDLPRAMEARLALARVQRQLARAKALSATGRFKDALALLTSTDQSGGHDPMPLRAEWHLALGTVLRELGELTEARGELERALWAAEEANNLDVAVDAIAWLIPLSGYGDDAAAEATRWAGLAEAMVRRTNGSPDRHASIAMALGRFYNDRNEPQRAIASYEQARALIEGSPGLRAAHLSLNLGRALKKVGRLEEARTYVTRALDQFEAALGPHHPVISVALLNLGAIHVSAGRDREAIESLDRAFEIARRVYGERHVEVAFILTNLALAQSHLGDPAAIDTYRTAIAIFEADPDHREQAGVVLSNLASLLIRQGRAAEALQTARRSLELNLATHGENDINTGLSRINLSEALQLSGQLPEALAEAEQAVEIVAASHGTEHRFYGHALARLGIAQLASRRRAAAASSLETALATLERTGPAEAIPEIELALAKLGRRPVNTRPR